nr:hypothetical protein [Tanacetum cinerariifolium]
SNTPLTHIPMRAILEVLQIGIRVEVIENQILSCRTPRIPRLRTLLYPAPTKGDQETYHRSGWTIGNAGGSIRICCSRVSGPTSTGLRAWPRGARAAPPSPVYIPYVPKPVYPEYIPPDDNVFPAEEQPLPAAASPTAESPGYIPGQIRMRIRRRMMMRIQLIIPLTMMRRRRGLLEMMLIRRMRSRTRTMMMMRRSTQLRPTLFHLHLHSVSRLGYLSDPSRRQFPSLRRMLRDFWLCLFSHHHHLSSLPQIPSPILPSSPPILPTPLPAASPPLQLLSSDRRADRPEGYDAGESSVAAVARPIEGRRADYGFVDSVEAEIRRRRAEDIRYGIRDTWIDPRDVAEEEALTTLVC